MKYPRRSVPTLLGALVFFPVVVAGAVFTVVNDNPTGPGSLAHGSTGIALVEIYNLD